MIVACAVVINMQSEAALDISHITDVLSISAMPNKTHIDDIISLNMGLVISMLMGITDRIDVAFHQSPFQFLSLPTTDAFFYPIYPTRLLMRGVATAIPIMQQGRRVLVFCKHGRHRSATMAACILIGMGMRAEPAMALVSAQRPVADLNPRLRARIRRFEADWMRAQSGAH